MVIFIAFDPSGKMKGKGKTKWSAALSALFQIQRTNVRASIVFQ
jgi:hypothetical protein